MKRIIKELQEVIYKFENKIVVNENIINELSLSEYIQKYNTNIIIKNFERLSEDELKEAIKVVEKYNTNNNEIRKTFYKDLSESLKDRFEIFLDQLEHYASTYGINFEGKMYHKNDKLEEIDFNEIISQLIFIDIITLDKALNIINNLIYKNIAFDSKDIKNLVEVIKYYEITVNLDEIQNKELDFYLKKEFGFRGAKDWEYLHRYLHDELLGKPLFIKSKDYLNILSDSYSVYNFKNKIEDYFQTLSQKDLIELSKRFNRDKKLFIAIKQLKIKEVNKKINKISKLSKKYHKPYKLPEYLEIIEKSMYDFTKVIEDLDIPYLVKIGNALKYRINAIKKNVDTLLVRIRNGKFYVTKFNLSKNEIFYKTKYDLIKYILSKKINEKLEYNLELDEIIDIAIPQSMKQFVGKIPVGSQIKIKDKEHIFVGISWYGKGVDFDLSVTNNNEKIGWNADYYNDGIFYSGDITSAPNGATELVYFKKINNNFNINVNLYNSFRDKEKFKFFIGKRKLNKNLDFNMDIEKLVDIKDLIFISESEMTNGNGMKLGVISPETFTFINLNTYGPVSNVDGFMDAFLIYKDSFMKFSELDLENKEDRETKKISELTEKELLDLVS